MAKIDTSKIEGYADMTAEQKLAALEAFEYEVPEDKSSEVEALRKSLDKANSEAADYKKQLRAKQTDTEKVDAEQKALIDNMKTELDTLRREKTISGYKAEYLAMGYDEKLAAATAEAKADGNTDVEFANMKKFHEAQKKAIDTDNLKNQPSLTKGNPVGASDDAALRESMGL